MTWNRDKNSWKVKAVNWVMLLHVGLWAGGLVKAVNWVMLLHVFLFFFFGGGGGLKNDRNRDKNSWKIKAVNWVMLLHVGLWGDGLVKAVNWVMLLHVFLFFLGGGGLKNDRNRDKNSWKVKAVNWVMLLYVRLWGGGGRVKKWPGTVIRT